MGKRRRTRRSVPEQQRDSLLARLNVLPPEQRADAETYFAAVLRAGRAVMDGTLNRAEYERHQASADPWRFHDHLVKHGFLSAGDELLAVRLFGPRKRSWLRGLLDKASRALSR